MNNRIQEQAQTGKAEATAKTETEKIELFRPLCEDQGTPDQMLSAMLEDEYSTTPHEGYSVFSIPTTYTDENSKETIGGHALLGDSNIYRWQGLFVTSAGQLAERATILTGEYLARNEAFRPIPDEEAKGFLLTHCPLIARLFGTPEGAKA